MKRKYLRTQRERDSFRKDYFAGVMNKVLAERYSLPLAQVRNQIKAFGLKGKRRNDPQESDFFRLVTSKKQGESLRRLAGMAGISPNRYVVNLIEAHLTGDTK